LLEIVAGLEENTWRMRSDFSDFFQFLCRLSPGTKRALWKFAYQYLAKMDKDAELLFMNYGFAPTNSEGEKLPLGEADEKHRLQIQLYHHVVSAVELKDKDVLEIGCGRGGGASYLMRYLEPRSLTAVDFSKTAIDFCNSYHSDERLSFLTGDAESLPFDGVQFDVIVNVESSRCYYSLDRFFGEVSKVLRPGGFFLFSDFRAGREIPDLRRQLENSGLELKREEFITPNILKAMEVDHSRKSRLIQQKAPRVWRNALESFTGTKGSKIYNSFESGYNTYFYYILQKAGGHQV
jgi:SAM-dependent methyltransferase